MRGSDGMWRMLTAEQHKDFEKVESGEKVNTVSTKKLTVNELRKIKKKKNLRASANKLKLLRDTCKIKLDGETTRLIIQRTVSRRPKHMSNTNKKTVFTEEDFKRFEEDYFGE